MTIYCIQYITLQSHFGFETFERGSWKHDELIRTLEFLTSIFDVTLCTTGLFTLTTTEPLEPINHGVADWHFMMNSMSGQARVNCGFIHKPNNIPLFFFPISTLKRGLLSELPEKSGIPHKFATLSVVKSGRRWNMRFSTCICGGGSWGW